MRPPPARLLCFSLEWLSRMQLPPPLPLNLASLPFSFSALPQVCKKTEAAAKASELAKMRAFKAELDAQIDDNQASSWGGWQERESGMGVAK